ncbi:MAG: hypothetical protein JXA99_10185 [Candidatus Lokiarchaeota archaeon]|nr:hypothetical protein [Candidatus Lokiarchaeota archaeon]
MANVKMNNKIILEKLQAEIILKLGKKMTQQEILDKIVDFAYKRLDNFIYEEVDHPILTEKIIERIKNNAIEMPIAQSDKNDDELIYGL